MVVRHPCQRYHGDKLRPYRTVAPVRQVTDFDNFGPDRSGTKDKFALLGLLAKRVLGFQLRYPTTPAQAMVYT